MMETRKLIKEERALWAKSTAWHVQRQEKEHCVGNNKLSGTMSG
jgi:hypothetical protein